MTKTEKIELVKEKIKGMNTAALVTIDEHGHLHGRPMATQEIDVNGDIWFMTSKDSHKIKDIENNPQVSVLYGVSSGLPFVSVSGSALLSNDREKIQELWNDMYKGWFESKEDPNIILIKISMIGAEYWDHTGGKLGAYIDIATAVITGDQKLQNSENEKLKIKDTH